MTLTMGEVDDKDASRECLDSRTDLSEVRDVCRRPISMSLVSVGCQGNTQGVRPTSPGKGLVKDLGYIFN